MIDLKLKTVKFRELLFEKKFLESSKTRLYLVGLIIFLAIFIFFVKSINFEKLRSSPSSLEVPPPPPPEILLEKGSVEGEQMAQVTTPSPVPNPKFPPCYFNSGGRQYGYGDANGDGVINESDQELAAKIAFKQIIPSADQRKAVDVDGNGIIDFGGDAILIAKYASGVISTFPICSIQSPTPTPTPTPTPMPSGGVNLPYDLKVNLDMGCTGSPSAQMVVFSWKPARTDVSWKVSISDDNWNTMHRIYEFQVSGDRTSIMWGVNHPASGGFLPAYNTLYKWVVSNQYTDVPGPDFRTPNCPRSSPSPQPLPTPSPMPPSCIGPLKIMSVNLMKLGDKEFVITQVDNLGNCSGLPVWVAIGPEWNWQRCTASGVGCSTQHLVPKPGNYPIMAVVDLDQDGKWYEPGEYDKRTLTVTPNVCSGGSCTP